MNSTNCCNDNQLPTSPARGISCYPCMIMGSIVFVAMLGLVGWGLYWLLFLL